MTPDPDIQNDPPIRFAFWGEGGAFYRLVTWAFVLSSLIHLWLPDAWQLEWLGADLVYLAGLGLLVWRGAWLGWVLSAVGLVWPLLFARDQLTQSVVLLAWAVAAIVGVGWDGWREIRESGSSDSNGGSDDDGETDRGAGVSGFITAVRVVTVLTYAIAALHKLNADFLDPRYSCAVYGVDEVLTYWNLGAANLPGWLVAAAPRLVLGAELSIAVLLAFGTRRVAWTVAVAFHIPLTLVMAPAFAFVMATGHVAFAQTSDIERLKEIARRRWLAGLLVGFGVAATAVSLLMHGGWPSGPAFSWAMVPKEWLLWSLLAWLLVAFPPWRASTWQSAWLEGRSGAADTGQKTAIRWWLPVTVGLVFLLNGLTPYLGLQYNHTAAMVSNLRVDRGCWNSVVFPESMRLQDPYIRIDRAYLIEPGAIPEYEKTLREELWNPPRIRQMRRNWCEPDVRPIYLKGTYRGEAFEIEDLCAGEPLPFGQWRLFGEPVFGDFLRFQKNLKRECPQRCIH